MNNEESAVCGSSLCKTYQVGDTQIEVLKSVDISIGKGQFTVISGDSGSGKTTLLNIIGSIDRPTSGKVIVLGEDLSVQDEDSLAAFRCSNIGFVFQSYNLISTLTVAENVGFPMEWLRKPTDYVEKRVQELLAMVGLSARTEHFPFQLSGGEQQRVAFARALANDPPLLLVDEPTGNLDRRTSAQVAEILNNLKDEGKTVVVATHDEEIVKAAHQLLRLEEGMLTNVKR
ncbi:MAG TPA: ABC transporter ATP-binding protein [Candidatus Acidoferrum sp.]|nr:ABC transporter ATP-binding protein [Candidatus Acidoferrum sp.]